MNDLVDIIRTARTFKHVKIKMYIFVLVDVSSLLLTHTFPVKSTPTCLWADIVHLSSSKTGEFRVREREIVVFLTSNAF